jgi:hypothetical protein
MENIFIVIMVLLVVLLVVSVFLMQKVGESRRSTSSQNSTSQRRSEGEQLLPPGVETYDAISFEHIYSGDSSPTYQELTISQDPILRDATRLRQCNFVVSVRAREPRDEYCIQISTSQVTERVTIYVICSQDYPSSVPKIISTISTFNSYGEYVEQVLQQDPKLLQQWKENPDLVYVIKTLCYQLSQATLLDSTVSIDGLSERYPTLLV